MNFQDFPGVFCSEIEALIEGESAQFILSDKDIYRQTTFTLAWFVTVWFGVLRV